MSIWHTNEEVPRKNRRILIQVMVKGKKRTTICNIPRCDEPFYYIYRDKIVRWAYIADIEKL